MTTQPEPTDPVPEPFGPPIAEPAEDLVAPEDVREADRGNGPEADLVVTEADADRLRAVPAREDGSRIEEEGPVEGI